MSLHAYVYRALIDTRQLCHRKIHALRANHCMIAAAVMQEDKK